MRLGLFHGNQLLCPVLETQLAGTSLRWGEWIQFDLPIQEMPRATKLSVSLCTRSHSTERKRKRLKEVCGKHSDFGK